jgi:hypothetical protein
MFILEIISLGLWKFLFLGLGSPYMNISVAPAIRTLLLVSASAAPLVRISNYVIYFIK